MLLFRIKSRLSIAYKKVFNIVSQSLKHEEIFKHKFIFLFIPHFNGGIFQKM